MNPFLIVAWLAVFVVGARTCAADLADGRPPLVGGVMVTGAVWVLADPLSAVVNGLALGLAGAAISIGAALAGRWS
jgi:hypothetical protein